MSEIIDIQEYGQLDFRLRTIASAIEELRQAVESQTVAQERFTRDLSEILAGSKF